MYLKFLSLGSGSSGNSYLLSDGNTVLMIDAGIGIRSMKSTLFRYGFNLNSINALLLTHDHSDHARTSGKIASRHNIPVFATATSFQGIDNNPVINPKVPVALRHHICVDEEFSVGPFHVTPLQVSHDSWDCVAYRIIYNDKVFAIITDCGYLDAPLLQLIGDADYLIIESNHDEGMLLSGRYPAMLKQRILSPRGHLSNTSCSHALQEFLSDHCQHVWLCHLSHDNNRPEIAYECSAPILQRLPHLQLHVLKRTEVMDFTIEL